MISGVNWNCWRNMWGETLMGNVKVSRAGINCLIAWNIMYLISFLLFPESFHGKQQKKIILMVTFAPLISMVTVMRNLTISVTKYASGNPQKKWVPMCLSLAVYGFASSSDADFCIESANPVLVYSSKVAYLTGICECECDGDHNIPSKIIWSTRNGFDRFPNCNVTGVNGKVSFGCC